MYIKNKHLYSEETLELARHGFINSSMDRLFILEELKDHPFCRITQLEMETGLNVRQIYYQLSVLRKMDYVNTQYHKGRYLVSLGPGYHKGREMMRDFFTKIFDKSKLLETTETSHLRIVK